MTFSQIDGIIIVMFASLLFTEISAATTPGLCIILGIALFMSVLSLQ